MRVVLDPRQAAPVLCRMPPERRRKAAFARLPDAEGIDVKPLDVPPDIRPTWRLGVDPWRAVYQVRGGLVLVIGIFRQREGYDRLA